jgi:microcin C transport system substrate-binding protein
MNTNLFYGAYTRTESYFSNSDFASRGLPEGRELEILNQYRGRVPATVFTEEYRLPRTDGSGNNREGLRRGLALLREAGWTVRDRRLVNAEGRRFEFEILLQGATFERVALPYVQWLERLGISARVRTVDPAQYQVRVDAFDYDMTIDSIGQGFHPGNEQRDYWTCAKARENGSQNVAGICDPVIDELVEMVIAAPNHAELIARTRALDRVLLHHNFMVPHWHSRSFRIAFWERFGRPEKTPRFGLGFPTAWWIDPARDAALAEARRNL